MVLLGIIIVLFIGKKIFFDVTNSYSLVGTWELIILEMEYNKEMKELNSDQLELPGIVTILKIENDNTISMIRGIEGKSPENDLNLQANRQLLMIILEKVEV